MNAKSLVSTIAAAAAISALAGVAGERDVSLAGEGWRFTKDPSCELRAEAAGFDVPYEPGELVLSASSDGLAPAAARLP